MHRRSLITALAAFAGRPVWAALESTGEQLALPRAVVTEHDLPVARFAYRSLGIADPPGTRRDCPITAAEVAVGYRSFATWSPTIQRFVIEKCQVRARSSTPHAQWLRDPEGIRQASIRFEVATHIDVFAQLQGIGIQVFLSDTGISSLAELLTSLSPEQERKALQGDRRIPINSLDTRQMEHLRALYLRTDPAPVAKPLYEFPDAQLRLLFGLSLIASRRRGGEIESVSATFFGQFCNS